MSQSDDEKINIRKYASFLYLQQIRKFYLQNKHLFQENSSPYHQLNAALKEIEKTVSDSDMGFDSKVKYEKIYSKLQTAIQVVAEHELKHYENNINSIDKKAAFNTLDPFFIQVYENENDINKKLFERLSTIDNLDDNGMELKQKIKTHTTNPSKMLNISHPDNPVNAFVTSMLGIQYNTHKKNNIPYVNFLETESSVTQERKNLRIGAQTQKEGVVNPTFKRYLLANARYRTEKSETPEEEKPYEYVYINLLKRPQKDQSTPKKKGMIKNLKDKFVRSSEGRRAAALEEINIRKYYKTAVITLPADNDFLLGKFSMKSGTAKDATQSNAHELLEQLTQSIQENKNDFFISRDVKKRIFIEVFNNAELNQLKAALQKEPNDKKLNDRYDQLREELFKEKVEELFVKSIKDILGDKAAAEFMAGKTNPEERLLALSPEQRSAIIFHFTKFHLSKHILDTLQPRVYNMSCKDAIDRGGIHTLWYHMNEKFERHKQEGTPAMTKDEFLMMLDYPALIVKYRTLNANKNLLWNVLQQRMQGDPTFAAAHGWAKQWLAENDPKKTQMVEKDATLHGYKNQKAKKEEALEPEKPLPPVVKTIPSRRKQ